MSEDNAKLWRSVENTDPAYMKEVQYPFKHYAIDAQYQILTATKLWGPMGVNWGVKNESFQAIPLTTKNEISVIYTAVLFHPGGEFGINADAFIYNKTQNGYKANNDYAKKISTDALTKGLSKLGFSADIFMGKYDGSKYDGIDSFGISILATDEQLNRMRAIVEKMKEKELFDNAEWLDKKITGGLSEENADKYIARAEKALEGK